MLEIFVGQDRQKDCRSLRPGPMRGPIRRNYQRARTISQQACLPTGKRAMNLARYTAHVAPGVPGRGSILGGRYGAVLPRRGHTSMRRMTRLGG
jgi:hypothetical protein